MFREGSGSAGWLAAIALMLVCAMAPAAAQELRTVLQTGDEVPRFGRIGAWGLHLAGIDERGRALIAHASVSDDGAAYWADGERFVPLLDPAQAANVALVFDTLAVQPGGTVIGRGFGGPNRTYTLFVVADGVARPLRQDGDVDAHGNAICEIRNAAANARGTVAIHAVIRPAGAACGADDDLGYIDALYLLGDGELLRVAATVPLSPAGWELEQFALYAINEADEALVSAWGAPVDGTSNGQHILAIGRDGVRLVYRTGESDGPNQIGLGSDPGYFDILTVNGAGDAIFRRSDDVLALYRTAGDRRVRLIAAGEPAAWGGVHQDTDTYTWPTTFSDNGDVLLSYDYPERLVHFPADGAPLVIDGSYLGYLNGRRDVVALRRPGDHTNEVVRYRNGGVRRLARTGDRLPGGRILATGGFGAACMAPNGALAVSATSPDSENALLCRDGRGVRPVSSLGDPRPDGRRFYSFDSCAFAGSDELVFIASSLVPSGRRREHFVEYFVQRAVYRATQQRLERVFGPGDVLDDGSVIRRLLPSYEYLLDADASGRVVALAATDRGLALVLAEADGTLRRVPIAVRAYDIGEDLIHFGPDSSVDHEYLSGISARPRAASGGGAAPRNPRRGGLRGMPAPEDVDPDSVWIGNVGLAESGGLFVSGSRQIQVAEDQWGDVPVLLLVDDGGVQTIGDASDYVDTMVVGGDRIAYSSYGYEAGVKTYSRGDALSVVVARRGDPTPLGLLNSPLPLGISRNGEVYFVDAPQDGGGEEFAFAVRDGALRVLGPVRSYNPSANAVSDAGVLVSSLDRLQVSGPEVSQASCPLPPLLTPVPVPTPTPRPGEEPLPPDLPFEPQQCGPGPCLSVSSASGRPGEVVSIDVWLDDGGVAVTATENELHFPGAVARILDCAANPEIDKNGTAFRLIDPVKAIVIALDNVDPIPSGSTLYTCQVQIADDAPANEYYLLACALPGASSPEGEELPIDCADGVLTVEGDENTGGSPQLAADNSSGGCTVQAPTEPGGALLLLLGAAAWLATRRRRAA